MAKSILIFRIGQLGDSLIALPALWAVRNCFPNAKLTLLCDWHPGTSYVLGKDLFGEGGLLDQVVTYPVRPKNTHWVRRAVDLALLLLRLRASRFDALVYLAPSGRSHAQEQRDHKFFRAAGIRTFYGFRDITKCSICPASSRSPSVQHEADFLLSRLAESGIPVPGAYEGRMDLELSTLEHAKVKDWVDSLSSDGGRKWVGFGPGTKMPAKKWPVERYLEVGQALIARYDVWPVIFGGREDVEAGNALLNAWGRGYNAAGVLGLRAAAAALERCEIYVGNDTGTMHLAAAAGTPCVAVFSARDLPGRWVPYGHGHKVLRTAIECEGCRLVECVEKRNECLVRIMPSDVIAACDQLLMNDLQRIQKASGL